MIFVNIIIYGFLCSMVDAWTDADPPFMCQSNDWQVTWSLLI